MGKRILFILIMIAPFLGKSQTYDPTKAGTALNKGIAVRGLPLDARSYFYDVNTFSYRPFNSTAEVLTYFNTSTSRIGNFNIYITISGVRRTYQFRDGTADGNLVIVDNIDATAGVTSVNGLTGSVSIDKSTVSLGNVDNTSDATKNAAAVTLTNKTLTAPILNNPKLNTTSTLNYVWTSSGTDGSGSWQPTQAIGGTVTTVNGSSGAVTIGFGGSILPNVQNTLDLDKPISTATQTALDAKASAATVSSHIANLSNPHSTTASQVGLGNVNNTSDANKPVSTATQTALNLKADAASPTFSGTIGGTYTIGGNPTFPATILTTTASQTVSGKSMSGASNTFSNLGTIGNSPTSTTVPITWSLGTGSTIPAATQSLAGAMTAADKTRLDSNYYAYQSATGVGIVNFVDAQNIRFKPITCTGCTATNVGDSLVNISVAGAPTGWQTLTDGATITFNVNNGTKGKVTLGGNRTLSITNASDGAEVLIKIVQDGSGNRTITLPAGSKVVGGGNGAVTLSTAAGAIDIITGVLDGSTWFWTYGKTFN